MSNSENAQIFYEGGQSPVGMTALTDHGDQTSFNSTAEIWSQKSGFAANVKPNGMATGGVITPAVSGTADLVDVSAGTCYQLGVLVSVSAATDLACTRPTPADTHNINSITVDSAGDYVVVTGTDDTQFSEVRAATGGPPLIPTTSVEVGQVRFSATTTAVVDADIFDTVNTHTERFDYPTWDTKNVRTDSRVIGVAGVDFSSALPLIHTGVVPKAVFASWNEPDFVQVPITTDFVPPETSHSTASKQVYQKTIASVSSSIGQGSFTAILDDGISDYFLGLKNETLWFKFLQDALKIPYMLTNGKLGIARTFPAGDDTAAECTISPSEAAVEVVS